MARKPDPHSPLQLHPLELAVHTILSPQSRGNGLSPAMRLVAMTMVLWGPEWDRVTFTPGEVADRTGLTPQQVLDTFDKMEQVHLVDSHADGWKLTLGRWNDTVMRAWRDRPVL